MAQASADRNLLFGILALQMDFISKDALIRAMSTWALEKTRPLGDILIEQGALARDGFDLLEALVRKHLALHGNDPEKSLAAVTPAVPVRRDLQRIADADVQTSLGHVAPAMSQTDPFATGVVAATTPPDPYATGAVSVAADGDPFATRPVAIGTPSSSGQRFRILRPYARGGLGEVFVAHDCELNREVALKEIREQHADDAESRARFLLEAEITGGLEHPSIVAVYGLGQYPDGRPYYAMRFIQGDSFKDAIDRFHQTDGADFGKRAVEYRELLGRFIDMCNAVAYAHSRGVIHRDLKPANVMLGKYGETLVVDWGLAKPCGSPANDHPSGERPLQPAALSATTETMFGSAVGTPQFMSPEQATGQIDKLGPASDIYSLGATLYVLLTGKPAYDGTDVGTVLQQVHHGDFPSPRQRNRTVPAALDAICMKAMALKPEDRYPSARALAGDIERWLADEPVSVYREPLFARLTRWARRHKPLVAGVAGLLATAVIALTVSTVLISREQQRTEEQRRAAEENFQTALRAVNDMLTEVAQDQLANEPRMEKKRRILLAKAQQYYQQFLNQRHNDPHLSNETAMASKRLADISRLLGENDAAREAYNKAIALLTPLADAHPNDSTFRRALADSWCNLGEVLRLTSRTAEARDAYQKALDIQTQLAAAFPDQPETRQELARTWYNVGILNKDTRQFPKAEEAFDQSIRLLLPLVEQYPKEPQYHQDLARGYLNLGPVLRATNRPNEAEQTYHKAITLQTGLIDQDPLSPAFRYELGVTYNNLGYLLQTEKRYADAEKVHRSALDLFDTLVVQFPNVPVYRKEQAALQNNLAIDLARTGNLAAASDNWQQAQTRFAKLAAEYPDVPDYVGRRGMAAGNLGWLALQQKDPGKARTYLDEGIRHIKAALKANPNNPLFLQALRDQYGYLIEALTALGKDSEAAEVKKLLAALDAPTPAKTP